MYKPRAYKRQFAVAHDGTEKTIENVGKQIHMPNQKGKQSSGGSRGGVLGAHPPPSYF